MVGFGTVTLNSHTNGNILANTLYANSNFGTNNYTDELSYVQNYEKVNGGSASSINHILVVGSDNDIATADNNNAISINDTKIDRPYNIIQDLNTANNPFIDLDYVKNQISGISSTLANTSDTGVTVGENSNKHYEIKLNSSDGAAYYNISASDLNDLASKYADWDLTGFEKNTDGSIIINVDCTGVDTITMPERALVYVDGEQQPTSEVITFTSGKVIWNFTNADGVTINAKQMTGMIIAVGATVNITQNLNGTVVAENINVNAESHRTDFTGTVNVSVSHDAYKTVDGNTPDDNQEFTFTLSKLLSDGTWSTDTSNSSEYQSVTNSNSSIDFSDITYTDSDVGKTYWYKIEEVKDSGGTNYEYTSIIYLVKIVVSKEGNNIVASRTYYKIADTDTLNSLISNNTIDTGKLADLNTSVDSSDVVFENRELISITGHKTWADVTYADIGNGTTNYTITVALEQKIGDAWVIVDVQDVTGDNSTESLAWNFEFPDLYKYDDSGNEIEYRVREAFTSMRTSTDDVDTDTFTGIIDDGTYYDTQEYNGQKYYVVVTDHTLVRVNGVAYYVNSYDATATRTNIVVNEKVDYETLDGRKEWVDNGNAYGSRPDIIVIKLQVLNDKNEWVDYTENGQIVTQYIAKYSSDIDDYVKDSSQDFSKNYDWRYEFTNLEDGKTYRVVEYQYIYLNSEGSYVVADVTYVDDDTIQFTIDSVTYTYNVTYDTNTDNIINTLVGTTNIEFTKIWVDDSNSYGTRPDKIYIRLMKYANGSWTSEDYSFDVDKTSDSKIYTIDNLDQYDDSGTEIIYSIVELAKDDDGNYSVISSGKTMSGVSDSTYEVSYDAYEITNTLTTKVTVNKIWDNDDDPNKPTEITVFLYDNSNKLVDEVTLKASNNWTYTFENLPLFDSNGNVIHYTVDEESLDYYVKAITKDSTSTDYNVTYSIENTYNRTKTSVSVRKIWEDYNDKYSVRPDSIYVVLYANNVQTNTVVELNSTNSWQHIFSSLDEYDADNNRINYTVYECELDSNGGLQYDSDGNIVVVTNGSRINGYTVTYDGGAEEGWSIINTLVETEISVTKNWDNNGYTDEESLRPDSITVYLKNGDDIVASKIITPDSNGLWTYTFENLPKYDKDGKEIAYEVSEEALAGYDSQVSGNATNGYVITNTLKTTEVTVSKTWEDKGNTDCRPDSITINLLADGTLVDTITIKPTSEGEWPGFTFMNLPVYDKNGKEITYSVEEVSVNGYKTTYNNYEVINTLITTSVTINKNWSDGNDNHSNDKITVYLYANNKQIDTATVTASNNWTYKFDNLPKYDSLGKTITYTVSEKIIEDYDVEITTDSKSNENAIIYNIKNTYDENSTSVMVRKYWENDSDNNYGTRTEIKVGLYYADGDDDPTNNTAVTDNGSNVTETLNESNNWYHLFPKLAEYKIENGVKTYYKYVVYELDDNDNPISDNSNRSNYIVTYSGSQSEGYVITNTLETTDITISKHWEDSNNEYNLRPLTITVNLYQNYVDGQTNDVFATATIVPDTSASLDKNWTYTFTNLPKYDSNGDDYIYTVKEEAINGYISSDPINSDDGTKYIINTLDTTDIVVTKDWVNDNESLRKEITVQLYQNGSLMNGKTITLNEENK
ncbi:MAG: Cna B-type domain-containing protein [Erysipelotrichaceae bacterium]|nr:Cna B-type domain-containing protein [Erysipelotrichaceae bacterium]